MAEYRYEQSGIFAKNGQFSGRTGEGCLRTESIGMKQRKGIGGQGAKLFIGFVCPYQKKVVTLRRIYETCNCRVTCMFQQKCLCSVNCRVINH